METSTRSAPSTSFDLLTLGVTRRLCVAFLLVLIGTAPLARAQAILDVNPAPSDLAGRNLQSRPISFKTNAELVLVPVTVVDPMNRPIMGLAKENFRIFEDKRGQEVKSFSREDGPVSIGLIIDSSRSMTKKMEQVRKAVAEFFKVSNPQDEFVTVVFGDTPREISDFTTAIEELQSKLLFVAPNGRTALLDAIYSGVSKMRSAKHPRKALLIISDGADNHSRYTGREIRSIVAESDFLVYAIAVKDQYFPTEEEEAGPGLLAAITDFTGGRTFIVSDPNDLVQVATEIGSELRNQYVIGYRPDKTQRDGKWHKIRVKVLPPDGMRPNVYNRSGYYASGE